MALLELHDNLLGTTSLAKHGQVIHIHVCWGCDCSVHVRQAIRISKNLHHAPSESKVREGDDDICLDCVQKMLYIEGQRALHWHTGASAVAALTKQQEELLGECRQLRGTLEGLRVEVQKAGEMAANPIATISARAKAAGAAGGSGIVFGVIYAYGKSKGWWD